MAAWRTCAAHSARRDSSRRSHHSRRVAHVTVSSEPPGRSSATAPASDGERTDVETGASRRTGWCGWLTTGVSLGASEPSARGLSLEDQLAEASETRGRDTGASETRQGGARRGTVGARPRERQRVVPVLERVLVEAVDVAADRVDEHGRLAIAPLQVGEGGPLADDQLPRGDAQLKGERALLLRRGRGTAGRVRLRRLGGE